MIHPWIYVNGLLDGAPIRRRTDSPTAEGKPIIARERWIVVHGASAWGSAN
ncbi:hypothetical protein ABMV07_13085 [Corynebacterium belfantii]|uniref:hypothetical protein n=1 Tax=Corynebacterium belfantii TaxID=2014537 RepID=UPI000ABEA07A|nr:hypothetical protein [Corynebacterium belfantii]MBG9311087.1 hypothetical protein [Corynebacterium belfantii]